MFFPTEFIYVLHMALRTNIYFYIALRYWFLGAFTKFRKATVSFIMSVRPSVHRHVPTRLPLDGFS